MQHPLSQLFFLASRSAGAAGSHRLGSSRRPPKPSAPTGQRAGHGPVPRPARSERMHRLAQPLRRRAESAPLAAAPTSPGIQAAALIRR
jgi:hypothetical protein